MTPVSNIPGAVSATVLAAFVIAPMTAPALVPAAIASLIFWHIARTHAFPVPSLSPFVVVFVATGLYLLVNCSWSLSPASAYAAVALYFVLVLGSLATIVALRALAPDALRATSVGICIGISLGAAFLCLELLASQEIRRALMSFVPAIRAKVPEVQVTGDWVTAMPGYLLNRNAAALSLCLWPMVLMTRHSFPRCKPVFYLMAGVAAATVMASDHETSKLALFGGAIAFGVSRFSLSSARTLMIAGWAVATMLVVPISAFAYSQQVYLATWLPESARHRVIIWGYVADQVARAPVLGVGINSTRPLSAKAIDAAEVVPGSKYARITTSHSHSAYLQVWYETGAIGAAMLFAWGLLLLLSVRSAPKPLHSYLYATFATAALVAASSFSLWAMWFMVAFALAAVLAAVGVSLEEKTERAAAGSLLLPKTAAGPHSEDISA